MLPKLPPHEDFLKFAEELADVSRKMLLAESKISPKISIKPDYSYVTNADKAVETKLREMIEETYPTHGILGEEFDNINVDAEFVWVLDPIDGTAPFIAGIPVYGTLIALAWKGKPYIGVMDHPATSDRWTGVAGLFAKLNGEPVNVKACEGLNTAFVTCSSPDFMTEAEQASFAEIRKIVPYVQYGGSCYAYGVLASGRTDLAIDCGLESFDVFASAAVIQGAGGFMTDWNGNNIDINWSGQIIAAGDNDCLAAAIHILNSARAR
ncbi:MAG: inositol monophosphatase [Rhodobacteraceae bacterium]|nr:inositol monophosphatase [Paracoccaceae bacterium]